MFVKDPDIPVKISRMSQRVKWRDPVIQAHQIDQTRLVIDDEQGDRPEFSFLVIGDSGSGSHRRHNPQQRIADKMVEQSDRCQFVLHTGDVVYLVGSSEYYQQNFIRPYRHFLVGGDRFKEIDYQNLVFNKPFFTVLGNHDYYDLPCLVGLISQLTLPFRFLVRSKVELDVGRYGSHVGDAYARAFLDYLCRFSSPEALEKHLKQHYRAQWGEGNCLHYRPGEFTRLPNRYYAFRYGNIDFFALDSNTINAPLPLSEAENGDLRQELIQRRAQVEQQKREVLQKAMGLDMNDLSDIDHLDDLRTKVEYLEEVEQDIHKQLSSTAKSPVDQAQLDWLRDRLIESWRDPAVRGRVLFFHHPPYVTEATKWYQGQTLAIRKRLRQVLDEVQSALGDRPRDQPLVDLVINGHAHCFEHIKTGETGHGDAHIDWLVCGGSGYSLRRQREEGNDITEQKNGSETVIARSHCFIGRTGRGSDKHRPYSCARIDVKGGDRPRFVVQPIVSDYHHHQWIDRPTDPFEL
jgi:hypothetical protein